MADIGKDFGLRQQLGENSRDFNARVKDVREGRAVADKFGGSKPLPDTKSVDKPGQDGSKTPDKKDKGEPPKNTLDTLVGEIKKLLEKIEPRLPVAALTA